MKVLNHLLTVVLLLLFCSTAQAQNVNVDDYDNIIYIKDATAHPGETVTLSVILPRAPQVCTCPKATRYSLSPVAHRAYTAIDGQHHQVGKHTYAVVYQTWEGRTT